MDSLVENARTAYATGVISSARLMGHSVNVTTIHRDTGVALMRMSVDCSKTAALMAALLAGMGRPAPLSLMELDAFSAVEDTMTGSDYDTITRNASECYLSMQDGLRTVLTHGADLPGWVHESGVDILGDCAMRGRQWAA